MNIFTNNSKLDSTNIKTNLKDLDFIERSANDGYIEYFMIKKGIEIAKTDKTDDDPESNSDLEIDHNMMAFKEPHMYVKPVRISQWDFMNKEDIEKLLQIKSKVDILKFIAKTVDGKAKGLPYSLYIELMYNVLKFCKYSGYNADKTGAVMSQFYLSHIFFTSKFDVAPNKVYEYFKALLFRHSLPFVPENIKVFTEEEPQAPRDILMFFCKVYLRNLPLIRFLCLPNFALHFNHQLEPEIVFKRRKKEKKKREKGGKKGKKKGPK